MKQAVLTDIFNWYSTGNNIKMFKYEAQKYHGKRFISWYTITHIS
jgi:hypothetical protein